MHAVICQTYKMWEMVCLDDGSCDTTPIVLEEHAWVDARIHVVCQQNAGPGMTRNHGLELVRGEYVVFQDSDDLLHRGASKVMLGRTEKENADLCICLYQSFSDSFGYNIDLSVSEYQAYICSGDLPLQFEDYQ